MKPTKTGEIAALRSAVVRTIAVRQESVRTLSGLSTRPFASRTSGKRVVPAR